jgi:hypothetical protein
MKKTILKITAVTAIVASMSFAAMHAQAETDDSQITVTVDNTFTLDTPTPLSFGTIVAVTDATDQSNVTISAAGVIAYNNPGAARVTEFTAGTAGQATIADAAPNTGITISYPTSVTLTCSVAPCTGTTPEFVVDTFVDDTTLGVVTTDTAGAATINFGATLETEATATAYEDGLYEGTLTITAVY